MIAGKHASETFVESKLFAIDFIPSKTTVLSAWTVSFEFPVGDPKKSNQYLNPVTSRARFNREFHIWNNLPADNHVVDSLAPI